MTEQELETMANKIAEVAPDQLPVFLKDPANFDYNVLEGYSDFVNKYRNVADFIGDKAGIKATIWKDFDGKFPSDARFQSLQEKYPWLNKEELKNWFDKTNEYKKFYEDEAKKEAERNLRKKEVREELGFLDNLLASEYSKQRYIDDPNASIIGKQGKFNPFSSQGAEEIMDVGLGTVGAAADFIPGWGSVVLGPAARTARDVAHKVYDSPYQKDWTQIGKDYAKDVGVNVGALILSNARKLGKMANTNTGSEVRHTMAAEEMMANTKEAVSLTNPMNTWVNLSDKDLITKVRNLPESPMKKELLEVVETAGPGRPINRQAVTDINSKYTYLTAEGAVDPGRAFMKGDYSARQPFANETFTKEQALATPYKDLTRAQKAEYWFNKGANQINTGKPGQIFVQEGANMYGRGSNPKIVETALKKAEQEQTIDRLISSYSLLWSKNKEPAEAKNNPIIKAAWEKWRNQ